MGTIRRTIMPTVAGLLVAASPLVGDVTGDVPGNDASRGLQPARTTPSRELDLTPTPPSRDRQGEIDAHLSARETVRAGNRLLDQGDPAAALNAYRQAEDLRPDTREIPFVQGLAHFTLGEYEQARQAFEMASANMDDALALDAQYGIGTTYHAEALANLDNPQLAVSRFENAMQRYHNVLSSRRDHQAAREANLKAGTMWRQLKQLLQEQEQQSQQNQEHSDNEEESHEEPTQQQDESRQQENDDQESPQDQQKQDRQGENEQEQQEQDREQPDGQEQQEAQKKEQQALREQAQRRLREMMQVLRDRKKTRREQEVQTVPVAPVDKDW